MEKLHREPVVHRQDYNAFINELKNFHQNKKTPFRQLPRINGREVNLFKLFNIVTSLGGLQKFTDLHRWNSISEFLKIPRACVNTAHALKQIYLRYLAPYEKTRFSVEDPEIERLQSSECHTRKQQFVLFHSVPMSYNHVQHEVSESSRATCGFSQTYACRTDYDKICMSLLSALPNEQDLALNICAILSNEGYYMLHLDQTPRLVTLLLCQVGIWPAGDHALKEVYLQGWEGIEGRDMTKFWRSSLIVKYPKLLDLCDWHINEHDEDENLLNLEFELGALNIEGQRILRVALIFYNLSFEKNNVSVLVSNTDFLRFLLLGMHSSWADLKQVTYDTLANIAIEINLSLEKNTILKLIFQTIMDGIQSPDRFFVMKSLDILAQLCNCEQNEDVIPSILNVEVYELIVSFLTIPDIMLLYFALEALYALSDLGRYACEKIVSVHKAIGALVSLLTLEPNQYGTSAQIRIKVVETSVPSETDPELKKMSCSTTLTKTTDTAAVKATAMATTPKEESEAFVCTWLKEAYEYCEGSSVARNDLYSDYVSHCGKVGRSTVVNANIFVSCVKGVFAQCRLKKIESSSGVVAFYHDGLQKKKVANIQTYSSPKKKTSSSTTEKVPVSTPSLLSAILKSALSNPSPMLKAPTPASPIISVSHPQTMSPNPSTTLTYTLSTSTSPIRHSIPANDSSTVTINTGSNISIKNLLANKVQQRSIQKQGQVLPIAPKMVICSPEKLAVNRTISSTKTNFIQTIRPVVTMPQTCIATLFTRAPIQTTMIANTSRVVSITPPRVLNPNLIAAPKIEAIKQALFANSVKPSIMRYEAPLNVPMVPVETQTTSDRDSLQSSPAKSTENLSFEKSLVDSNDSILSDCDSLKDYCLSSDGEINSLLSLDDASIFSSPLGNTSPLPIQTNSELSVNRNNKCPDVSLHGASEPTAITSSLTSQQNSLLSSMLNSVLAEFGDCNGELKQKTDNDKVYHQSPLLNGRLDKDNISLTKDLNNVTYSNKSTYAAETNSVKTSNNITSFSSSLAPSALVSNGGILSQVCANPTTLSGTLQVQSDQKGVVRLHIESPENSNQGSDLSSISDIARTLECASKTISQTNAECGSQVVPFSSTCETTTSVAVINTSAPILARAGQQFIVVTPAINQPQLLLQSPNIKFRFVQGIPRIGGTTDLIGIPSLCLQGYQLSPVKQTTAVETSNVSIGAIKRPSNDSVNSPTCSDAKIRKIELKPPLLEITPRLPVPVSSNVISTSVHIKPSSIKQPSSPIIPPKLSSPTMSTKISSPITLSSAMSMIALPNVDGPKETQNTPCEPPPAKDNAPLVAPTNVSKKLSSSPTKLEYVCEWKNCYRRFSSPGAVLIHAGKVHAPYSKEDMMCLWEGCDAIKRRHLSLLTHLQDWHCNEKIMRIQALRKQQVALQGKTSIPAPQMPPPHPGYSQDAAILAIRRHALQYLDPKQFSEEKESALAKSIRLTSALTLRNLVTHSSLAKTYLRCYEPQLAYLAMSPVESSRAIAQCLSELSMCHDG